MPKGFSAARRKRKYNLRLIKATWPYTVQDIAALLGVHKNAVGRWMREGLCADRQQRPFLIRGDELARFLGSKQTRRKAKCGPTQFYCFKCRAARDASSSRATLQSQTAGRVWLKANCDHCGTRMNKVLGAERLHKIRSQLTISMPESKHITECGVASVNGDLEMQS